MRKYFVAYAWESFEKSGRGNLEIELSIGIVDKFSVELIERKIMELNPEFTGVVMTFFSRYDPIPEEGEDEI